MRSIAAVSLGHLGFDEAIDPLIAALKDSENKVIDSVAVSSDRNWQSPQVRRKLRRLLPKLDNSLKETVRHIL